ncbi:MAG TPA: TIGR01777 family oxidoreductase [Candidatus Hydrogenedentes bacterium]|nr:TIGR01777 family oxidoreductase [Candidatus Hydrogenedentota bacterium]
MRILVTGSTGLVGEAVVARLHARGDVPVRLVRGDGPFAETTAQWDPARGNIDVDGIEGLDAVVHLAGENIASGRWTAERKARIRESRVGGTRLLCEALAKTKQPPPVLISASAIGYYGDRGEELLDETSPPADDFLAEVCKAWEAATAPAVEAGIRVVHLRIGAVLSAKGGALARMVTPFKLGLGGVVGNGRQYMSWIAIDDLVTAIDHCIACDTLVGPVNAMAPNPVTNREFTKALGKVMRRPTLLPMPAFAVRLALGEMGIALLLTSTRATPKRLLDSDFVFRHPHIEGALRALLA